MDLKANTLKSAKDFTEHYKDGISLKSRALKNWIQRRGFSQTLVAELLCMSKRKFRSKLFWRKKFNQNEIADLIRLMGARAAIKVFWFPTLQEKRRIEKYVWEGRMSNKYNPNFPHCFDTPNEKKKREISEQESESGENWEQSEELENLIFDSDELPSRRFMRRRNNG